MGLIHEVMDAFREAPSNSERGTKFEKLMVRYFDLDPLLPQQYDEVWRWIDWPGRKGKPDTGIDLVARVRDSDEYTAIQCKITASRLILGTLARRTSTGTAAWTTSPTKS